MTAQEPRRSRLPHGSHSDLLYTLLDSTERMILVLSRSGVVDYANPAALHGFGYDAECLLGRRVDDLLPTLASEIHDILGRDDLGSVLPNYVGHGSEATARREDGATFAVEAGLAALPTPDGQWVLAGITNVTEQRRTAERLGALNRAHVALADASAAILGADGPQMLYEKVCEIIHGASGRSSAWVGLVGRTGRIAITARAGDIGPLEAKGPDVRVAMPALGRVVAESTIWQCGDLESETSPEWAAWAREHGVVAVASLPLRCSGRVAAVLTLQSKGPELIEDEFMAVLGSPMSVNLSNALERFETQDRLRRIEAQRIDLLSRLVAAEEQERGRIAANVHDHSIQTLAAMDLRLGMIAGRIAEAAPELEGAVSSLQDGVGEVIHNLRYLLFELEPTDPNATLVDQLGDALEHVFTDLPTSTSIRVDSERHPDPAYLELTGRGVEHAVRICKEALTNARRHAQASRVEIVVVPDEEGIEIAVVDDGIGPQREAATVRSAPGHRGLTGMRDRAELIGGWCRLERDARHTTLRFWLPREIA